MVLKLPAMFWVTVCPAETVTIVVAILNSVWYSTIVYVPGFIRGDVNAPFEDVLAQYCAWLLYQWTTPCIPLWIPVAVPLTVPRPEAGT